MELNGREVGFMYSMRAAKLFADFCPDRDFSRIGEALTGKYGNIVDNQARFIIALSTAYAMSAEHRAEGCQPVTMDELLDLDQETFQALFLEAARALQAGRETHVQTKPAPRKKATAHPENQS